MKFNYNFNYQTSIKLFINASLNFFDHPVVKQTGNKQFLYIKFNQINCYFIAQIKS